MGVSGSDSKGISQLFHDVQELGEAWEGEALLVVDTLPYLEALGLGREGIEDDAGHPAGVGIYLAYEAA